MTLLTKEEVMGSDADPRIIKITLDSIDAQDALEATFTDEQQELFVIYNSKVTAMIEYVVEAAKAGELP